MLLGDLRLLALGLALATLALGPGCSVPAADGDASGDTGTADSGIPSASDPVDTGSGNPTDTVSGDPVDTGSGNPTDSGTGDPSDTGSGNPTDTGSGDPSDTGSGDPTDTGSGDPTDTGSGDPLDTGSGDPVDTGSGDPASDSATDTSTTSDPDDAFVCGNRCWEAPFADNPFSYTADCNYWNTWEMMYECVVTDDFTDLEWAEDFVTYHTWDEALGYCDGLSYGGYDDWRLPTTHELETLVDYSRDHVASSFPDEISDEYIKFWAAESFDYYVSQAWYVDFSYGEVNWSDLGGPLSQPDLSKDNKTARCVRGGSQVPDQGVRFEERVLPDTSVIVDHKTGLIWSTETWNLDWQTALTTCEDYDKGGSTDWHVPSVYELRTLLNREVYDPATDYAALAGLYWTSTLYYWTGSSFSWRFNFFDGVIEPALHEWGADVRCVHR